MRIKHILYTLRNLRYRLRRKFELLRYNDFTIAEYFRKQGAEIGENNRIEIRSLSTEPFLIQIGNHCTIAPEVHFLPHDGAAWVFTEEIPSIQKFGRIEIRDNCFIGIGSMILGNVKIGPNSVVGAGSVVTKTIPPNTVAAGNPARVICSLDDYKRKVVEGWTMQRPPGYLEELQDGVAYPPEHIQKLKSRDMSILRTHLLQLFREQNR